jgi:hypothetical protein
MDIHKPKPVHSIKEFLKEFGIIVLGVVTALAFEQAAEAVHWHHEVSVERDALLDEVRGNLDVVKIRMLFQPCIDKRLNELKTVIDRHDEDQPLGIKGHVGVPIAVSGSRGTWAIALSGQGLSHESYSEQVELSGAFANFENWDAITRDERSAWIKLGALDDSKALTDNDWALIRQAYVEARAASRRVADVGPFVLQSSKVGQSPQSAEVLMRGLKEFPTMYARDQEICRPLL